LLVLSRTCQSAVVVTVLTIIALALPASATTQPQLVDQTGRHFTFASLRGTPIVVTFVAAHCTDACPLINAQFSQTAQRFAHDRTNVKLLTITLDPEHDPPPVMRDLARRFDANPKQWLFISGRVPDVHRVMAAFGVVAQQGRRGYAEMHTTFVYFIDKRGNLRKTILASTALSTQIVDEVHRQFPELASR
jgi:cytochrome oxidase Cu insertion factor (SCO1/SenC/PrrC family)